MNTVTYTHRKNPRSKSLKITVSSLGEVIVSTPPYAPKALVDRFVQTNHNWIELQQRKIASKMAHMSTDTSVHIFGKEYQRHDVHTPTIPVGIHIRGEEVVFNAPYSTKIDSPELITRSYQNYITAFLKKTAHRYIIPRTKALATTMNTSYGSITLKEQKTRWGSCSSLGNLTFNWRLVHFEPPIIDYVIIHELAHRTHMDHSTAFWKLVETYDPEYKIKRGWLKRNGLSLS